jgi:hypothetical protein
MMTGLKTTLLAVAAFTAVSGAAYALDSGDWMRDPDVA